LSGELRNQPSFISSNDEVRFFAALLTDKVSFDFRIFSPKICLIFVGWGGSFEFPRGLHHVGLF